KKTVGYLSALGHRRMAFIGHHSTLGPISERRKAFLESVHRCSPSAEAKIFAGPDGLDGGRQAARELLESDFRPTAILCVNDFMAVGVMRELHEEGLQIPKDISRSEEHTSELQSPCNLVCRLLLEKKKELRSNHHH